MVWRTNSHKKRRRAYLCCWRPGELPGPACFPFSVFDRWTKPVSFPLAPRGPAQEVTDARPPFLVLLTSGPHATASSFLASRSTQIRPSQISCRLWFPQDSGVFAMLYPFIRQPEPASFPFIRIASCSFTLAEPPQKSDAAIARFRRLPFQSSR
jgi:hypothetical protein